ncbi:MAG: 4Fe-4S dicluster domain-containing protein [Nitrospinae bacterium]|nr:4Fe-4S dicluster domain-containing protein [Nitrospinota bacterium]
MTIEKDNMKTGGGVERRKFLKAAAAGLGAMALPACGSSGFQKFFQSHFREMSPGELETVLKRMEEEYGAKYGKKFSVNAEKPMENVLFGYGLDLSRCIGCRRCVYACVEENNQSRDPQIHWISVLRFKKGDKWMDLENSTKYYNPEKVPEEGYFYVPIACQQCENPPCTKVCPVQATWKEKDGIIVVDYNWCIGCRYCMAACPYGARHFNLTDPGLPPEEANPATHYLGNRPRPRGVVEKCTFCVQRTRQGRYPACSEICPTGARKFGNMLDPESEIRYLIDKKRVFRLKEDLNTVPKFFYFL